ncbi:hypothetical protein LTR17_026079 [Elasticomyces elasticus]|nr:hypothetical protein LTR17_026079 [Elasticomyces elasticus]
MEVMKTYNFEDRLRRLEHAVLQNSTASAVKLASASVTPAKPSLDASNILHAADGGDVGEDVFEVEDSSALPLHTRAEGMNEHDNMYTAGRPGRKNIVGGQDHLRFDVAAIIHIQRQSNPAYPTAVPIPLDV